ncbi:MAG: glutathione S-transferase N-terminal domain-containing protein [Gammaproteobacteria bacterium]
MKLYYMPGACSLADHITLEWIGKPYETHNLSHDDLKKDDYLRINPTGKVPALEKDGWVLTQNAAILHYLADTHPEAGLTGDGTPEGRAEVNRWLGFVNADVHPAFGPLFGAAGYLGEETFIEKAKAQAKKLIRENLELVDQQLEGRDWLVGTRSIADPYLFVILRWAKGMKIDLSGLDNLERFFQHMHGDAAVKKVLKDEGLG